MVILLHIIRNSTDCTFTIILRNKNDLINVLASFSISRWRKYGVLTEFREGLH